MPVAEMVPRMARGFHCSLSLRACTITLASIQLTVSLISLISTLILEVATMRDPQDALRDDFDYNNYDVESGYEELELTTSAPEPKMSVSDVTGESIYPRIIYISFVFESVNLILCLIDVALSCTLIAGAAKRRASLIRPWLFLGAAFLIYDILYFVVTTAEGLHFMYRFSELLHIPLAAYLWVVAWSLYLDCNEEARRSASSPVCMSALVEDGEEDVDQCSVPYATLGKPN